jgi:hypothetical protein
MAGLPKDYFFDSPAIAFLGERSNESKYLIDLAYM